MRCMPDDLAQNPGYMKNSNLTPIYLGCQKKSSDLVEPPNEVGASSIAAATDGVEEGVCQID